MTLCEKEISTSKRRQILQVTEPATCYRNVKHAGSVVWQDQMIWWRSWHRQINSFGECDSETLLSKRYPLLCCLCASFCFGCTCNDKQLELSPAEAFGCVNKQFILCSVEISLYAELRGKTLSHLLSYLVHGGEQLPVIICEFISDVFRAHLFKDVGRSLFWTLLLLQRRLTDKEIQTEN